MDLHSLELISDDVDFVILKYTPQITLTKDAAISQDIREPGGLRNFLYQQYNIKRITQFIAEMIPNTRDKMSNIFVAIFILSQLL